MPACQATWREQLQRAIRPRTPARSGCSVRVKGIFGLLTVRLVFSPLYGPELNPIESVWRALKDALAWGQFPNLHAQQGVGGLRGPRCGPDCHCVSDNEVDRFISWVMASS